MKRLFLCLAASFLFGCGSEPKEEKTSSNSTADILLVDNSIQQLAAINHQELMETKGDFSSFKSYLNRLSNDSLTSIPYALDYIKTCLINNLPERDSVFFLFDSKFYAVAYRLNDSLYSKYSKLMLQLEKDSSTAELKIFRKNLESCGIDLFSSEGMFYIDVMPDFFYEQFKNRVSPGVAEYLKIRKDELKVGFSEDAGLLISFEDVYKRIKRWEHFMNEYPNTVYSESAKSYYSTYVETLMTGMDNSRLFDFETQMLLPEVKSIYEKIISEENQSTTKTIFSSYYSFLERHSFKDNDSIPLFLKANSLSSMLAVQPHTR